ncbi:MAG: hypothetical protein OHK005_12850 [Candidatus Methylacidiphilales bacterium]
MRARLPHRLLEEFRLLQLLGDGGNGLVYLAEDIRTGLPCAIKEFALGPDASQRFFRELSFLFTLNHPNLVRCLNFFHGTEGASALILEYADLGSLRHRLETAADRRLTTQELLPLARQATAGLCALHAAGIVHCDVKPENFLLFSSTEGSVLKVSDFGIALLLTNPDATHTTHGSPLYMAPEQFYQRPTAAADIYSLALILAEALVGHPLRQPGSPEEVFAQARRGIDWEQIPEPSWRAVLSRMADPESTHRPTDFSELSLLWDQIESATLAPKNKTVSRRHRKTSRLPPPSLSKASFPLTVPGREAARWLVPNVQRLVSHPLPHRLWLLDPHGLDVLDWNSRRLQPRIFPGPTQCLSPDGHWLVQPSRVFSWSPSKERFLPAFPLTHTPEIFLSWPQYGLVMADHSTVRLLSFSGVLRAEWPLSNYVFRPQFAFGKDVIWASSGPLRPALHSLSPDAESHSIPLPGPVLALQSTEQGIHILTQGHSPDDPGHWLFLQTGSDYPKHLRHLPPLLHRVRSHGPWFSAFDLEDRIHFLFPNPSLDLDFTVTGKPLDDCWMVEAASYFMLAESEGRTSLSLHPVQVSTEPLAPSFA